MSDLDFHGDAGSIVFQKTLKKPITCTGVALHSGAKTSMTLLPAEADTGIVFKRTDANDAIIPARFDTVVDTRLCTMLGNEDGVTISTVEHLLSALYGLGIDNVMVEVSGPEVPVMDGSAAPFVFLVECAGITEQDAPRKAIRILKPVVVEEDGKRAELAPGDGFTVDFEIDFDSKAISRQSMAFDLAGGSFKKDIARARTFGFLHEVEALRSMGLAKGGSLDNAVVVSGDKVLNEEGLRYDDEFVRHKILDALGDLFLAGAPIIGAFTASCSGHALNNKLLHALFADPTAWTWDVVATGAVNAYQAQAATA